MNGERQPLPPTLLLAVAVGMLGTGLLALGVLLAVGALEAPEPLLEGTLAQAVLIAVGLVLTALEVRAILSFARERQSQAQSSPDARD